MRFLVPLLVCASLGCKPETLDGPTPVTAKAPSETVAPPKVQIQLLNFEGIEKLVASHRGKVVVMDAWSTSCPPCLKEFPNLVALSKEYRPENLACISLSFDYEGIGKPEEVLPAVQKFLDSQQATFDNVVSTEDSDALNRKFKLTSIPAVFVYDREGKLVKRFDNEEAKTEADAFTYKQVGELVAELLK